VSTRRKETLRVPTRLLAIGDIHLGRQSGRLPDQLEPDRFRPAAALAQAVKAAIHHQVAAVLLAGDLVDSTRDQYHALGVLTAALSPLREAGIRVIAVAGNHDHAVLPRLNAALPELLVLGRDGRWETETVDGPGGPVRVLGWSFPQEWFPGNPAESLARLPDGPPVIGLLHADLDASESRYAPVRRRDLFAAGPCRWLLGHVHAPSLDPARDDPGYLGSLVGLDPSETGPRGAWLVEIEGRDISLRFLPLAPLRWDALDVPVDDLTSPQDELPALLTGAISAFAAARAAELGDTQALGLRVRLVGRAADQRGLTAAVADLVRQPLVLAIKRGLTAFIDRVESGWQPSYDLAALAEQDDPPGLLARDLLALREGRGDDLLREAHPALRRVDRQPAYRALAQAPAAGDTLADDVLGAQLLQAGYRLLDDLLRAREVADGPA
jgi:hypothetical protein